MLRRHHRFFQTIQVVRDAMLVALSFVVAYAVRFSFPELLPFESISPRTETVWVGVTVVVAWPAVGWLGGLYFSRRTRTVVAEIFDVVRVSAIALLVLVTLTYFIRDQRFSRGIILLWAVLSTVAVATVRALSRMGLRYLRARGYNLRHVLVVGTGEMARRASHVLADQAGVGFRIKGFVSIGDKVEPETVDGWPVLGTVADLASLVGPDRGVDHVIVALPIDELGALKGIMEVLSQEPVDVRLVPDFFQYATLCGSIDEVAGLPIVDLQASPLFGWSMAAKRAFDVLLASAGLILVSPLMAAIAATIKATSPGPILFRQERVGMDGEKFDMLKFRTMHLDAEADGVRMALPSDPRCTRLGAWLRRLSLDEVPQLWNVLRGDMSLVGPRPERPCFIEYFKREIPRYALRHKIKAGMTGLAQVNGMRGNTDVAKRIELDLYYIEHWSLFLDLKILLRTIFGGFLSPNAY
jgi:Undecaprenyl-phosphate glucose phosphotransferase